MSTHFFAPDLSFRGADPGAIVAAIARWEAGDAPGSAGVQTPAGAPLPRLWVPDVQRPLHRYGYFRSDSACSYALRLELLEGHPTPHLRVSVLLRGQGAPTAETRAGGALLTTLLAVAGSSLEHDALPVRVRRCEDDARAEALFLALVDKKRRVPIVVVSCLANGTAGLDATLLLGELGLMAQLWSLDTREASFALAEAFRHRGFDTKWSCYDGGLRVYGAGFDPAQDALPDQPLLLRRSYDVSDPGALAYASEWARRALSHKLDEQGWKEARRHETMAIPVVAAAAAAPATVGGATLGDAVAADLAALRLRLIPPHPPLPTDAGWDHSAASASELAVPPLETALEAPASERTPLPSSRPPDVERIEFAAPASERPRTVSAYPSQPPGSEAPLSALKRRMSAVLTELAAIEGAMEELASDLEAAERGRAEAERRVSELEQQLNDVDSSEAGAVELPKSAGETLELLSRQFERWLDITRYARARAEKSGYRDSALLSQAVACVALGGGDYAAVERLLEQRLGARASCKPKDSKETMKAFGDERRFPLDDGTVLEWQQHITIGHGQRNPNETLHIYFRQLGARAQLLYVGEHLRTVSGNT